MSEPEYTLLRYAIAIASAIALIVGLFYAVTFIKGDWRRDQGEPPIVEWLFVVGLLAIAAGGAWFLRSGAYDRVLGPSPGDANPCASFYDDELWEDYDACLENEFRDQLDSDDF